MMFKVIQNGIAWSVVTSQMRNPVDRLMASAARLETPHTDTTRENAEKACAELNKWFTNQSGETGKTRKRQ